MNKIIYEQTFVGGMNTVLAKNLLSPEQYVYMLNCDVTSTADGNVGIVTNIKGDISVDVQLPEGENRTIFSIRNEESNKLYYAVWNSLGYNTWFEFDYVSKTIKTVIQSITDTGGVDIFKWEKGVLINSANIVNDNLLYWTMKGHPARKINISKAVDKSFESGGYGNVILEEYTRANKKSPAFSPSVRYDTDTSRKKNDVYRKLFQFTARYWYDDNEVSAFSDFSQVAVPSDEVVTGGQGVSLNNNVIKVGVLSGGMLVRKIEIAMRSTTDVKGVYSDWVSVGIFDKTVLDIPNNTEFEYSFYNDNTYLALAQEVVNQPQSDFPDEPLVQEYAYNTMVYGNFKDGFPSVPVDFSAEVVYSDLFVPSGQENKLNEPSFIYNFIDHEYESGGFMAGGGWRKTEGEIVVGPDVKSGNLFRMNLTNDGGNNVTTRLEHKATLTDDAQSVASKFRTYLSNHSRTNTKGGYVDIVKPKGGGAYGFRFKIWNNWNLPYIGFSTSVTPVNYSTLKNLGNSVPNEKLGSSARYAIVYKSDEKRSLAYGNNEVVQVKTLNELGDIKKVTTILDIKHKAPSWAKSYAIYRTKNLTQSDWIQFLVQRAVLTTTLDGEQYYDLSLGSFFTYQKVHPNSILNYEFKKGDRLRLLKNYNTTSGWSVPSNVIEYEVLDYYPEKTEVIQSDVIIDGSSNIKTSETPNPNRVGSNIVINGNERTIIGVTADGYNLNSAITIDGASSSEPKTYPSFSVINRNGVVRIKMDPSYPITVNGTDTFALVEVYNPSQSFVNAEFENYYNTGYEFEIYQDGPNFYHRGNSSDQTATSSARVAIEGFDNYVRNRSLVTNTSETNPQSAVTTVEDKSFSDFYNSDLSSLGRPSVLDDSRGVVHFEDRLVWSNNFIEDTKINGLNMFLSTNRVDYNDKYGSIQKIVFHEGRLYIFKYLKTGWVPVKGIIMSDTSGQNFVGISSRLLPDKMEYFVWEGGIADNPESVVREGNNIYGVSPTSQVIFYIGGSGVEPASKIFGIDNYARELIVKAKAAGAHIFGGINRKKNQYLVMIESYEDVVYSDRFNASNSSLEDTIRNGAWQIVDSADNGTVSVVGDVLTYHPNLNFSGIDNISYKSANGIVRHIVINVLGSETETVWHEDGQYCVVTGGARTGYVAYSLLKEYNIITGEYTGVTKPNASGDPDYVAPYEDLSLCPLGLDYVYVAKINRRINTQSVRLKGVSSTSSKLNFIFKDSDNFSSGSTLFETGLIDSGEEATVNIPIYVGDAYLFIVCDDTNYSAIEEIYITGAYLLSANFNNLDGLKVLELDQSGLPSFSYNDFSSLSINNNVLLEKLVVKNHNLASINLDPNNLLEYIDVSYGRSLVTLHISSWSRLTDLIIHESLFTSFGYSTQFVDSVIANANNLSPNLVILRYGLNNSTGIMPSTAIVPQYNLLSSRASVVGRSPVVTDVDLTINFLYYGNVVEGMLYLSAPLSVSINVNIRGYYEDSTGVIQLILVDKTIPANTTSVPWSFTGFSDIQGANAFIQNVSPNPAGGVSINY